MTRYPGTLARAACIACTGALLACSPRLDWREIRGVNAPYSVMLPAKPASQTRAISIDGQHVVMTMTGADVDGVTFAVGSAELPDEYTAREALPAMKTALVRNIQGTIRSEKSSSPGTVPATLDIEASGKPDAATDSQPRLLAARFLAKGKWVFQLVVTGKQSAITHDSIDTFFESFKPD